MTRLAVVRGIPLLYRLGRSARPPHRAGRCAPTRHAAACGAGLITPPRLRGPAPLRESYIPPRQSARCGTPPPCPIGPGIVVRPHAALLRPIDKDVDPTHLKLSQSASDPCPPTARVE